MSQKIIYSNTYSMIYSNNSNEEKKTNYFKSTKYLVCIGALYLTQAKSGAVYYWNKHAANLRTFLSTYTAFKRIKWNKSNMGINFEYIQFIHSLIWADDQRNSAKEVKQSGTKQCTVEKASELTRFNQMWLTIYGQTTNKLQTHDKYGKQ